MTHAYRSTVRILSVNLILSRLVVDLVLVLCHDDDVQFGHFVGVVFVYVVCTQNRKKNKKLVQINGYILYNYSCQSIPSSVGEEE